MLEDEFIGWIPDQQEKAEVEITLGSPNKSSTPAIGMKFDCDDSAYEFYKDYEFYINLFTVCNNYSLLLFTGFNSYF